MQSGLGGPEWHTERGRDLRERQVEVVVKDDDESLIGIEPAKATFERITLVGGGRLVADGGPIEPGQFDFDRTTLVPPELVVAGADEQPVEPSLESIGVA